MKKTFISAAIILLATAVRISDAQPLPPIRQLGPVTTVGTEPLGAVSAVRQLPGGRVLVNDILGRRVLLFDSTLKNFTLVADTTSATASAYGAAPGGLIAYRGDSTLFVDPGSLSMLVIDPAGKVGRVMSVPRANDARFLIGGPFGTPGFDPRGRLIYRAPPRMMMGPMPGAGSGSLPQAPAQPDSAALIAVDLATRKVDTITFFKTPRVNMTVSRTPDGGIRAMSTINPLPQADDWTILPDGTIALVRHKDFHIDWIAPDGSVSSSPKIPFQWERLTDEAKVAYIDSVRTAMERNRAGGQIAFGGDAVRMIAGGAAPGGGAATATPGTGSAPNGGSAASSAGGAASGGATATGTMTVTTDGNTTVTAVGPGGAGGGPAGGGPRGTFTPTFVSPTELPDYKPAFVPGSTRADTDGNLWIRTSQNVGGRPVYNVVNRKGELIDRVQLPQNRVLAGFGQNGVVYLAVRDGRTAHLEAARVK